MSERVGIAERFVPSAYFAGKFRTLAPRQPRDNVANGGVAHKSVIPKMCVSPND